MHGSLTDLSADVPASGKVELDQAAHEKVLNLAQDIMGNVNKIPTPKQVGLSLHILKETRSKKTVTLLNRLGNCISYDDAQRYMTTIAENVDLQIEKDGVFIPSNLTPGVFTHCAIDNLDFDEYTRDGSTLHATTIIFYQYPVGGNVKEQVKIPLLKRRSRSLEARRDFLQNKSSRVSLKDRRRARSLVNVTTVPKDEIFSKSESKVWNMLLAGVGEIENETDQEFVTPTWSSYHTFLQEEQCCETTIAYGPIIRKSPTDPAVVEEALQYCKQVMDKICQDFIIVNCDHLYILCILYVLVPCILFYSLIVYIVNTLGPVENQTFCLNRLPL